MLHRHVALALGCATAFVAAFVVAPVASAATLRTDAGCYQETQEVVLDGSGYAPLSRVTVTRDGKPLGTAQTDSNGAFQRKFATPQLPLRAREHVYTLAATDALNSGMARYRATKVLADFAPASGDPTRLRVRFTIFGFGLANPRATVYLHYVRGSTGTVRRTIALGSVRGPCGVIRRTKLQKLFPFAPERGMWILQFDTSKRYERATSERTTPWVRKPVEVIMRRR
jgi:hypothetical protein